MLLLTFCFLHQYPRSRFLILLQSKASNRLFSELSPRIVLRVVLFFYPPYEFIPVCGASALIRQHEAYVLFCRPCWATVAPLPKAATLFHLLFRHQRLLKFLHEIVGFAGDEFLLHECVQQRPLLARKIGFDEFAFHGCDCFFQVFLRC